MAGPRRQGWSGAGLPDGRVVEQIIQRTRPERFRLVLTEALRLRAMAAGSQERWEEMARALEQGRGLAQVIP